MRLRLGIFDRWTLLGAGARHSYSTRRSVLGFVGGTLAATAGRVGTGSDPEPTGRKLSVDWRLDPESTGEYEHFRTLRDGERGRTWFEGRFVATAST